ncbi:DUF6612 family protein [Bacillus sp. OxB-1]|uniref:DUF6612 family protein n=1 Tax=Bacillus sp. (strain OxB-1) TaxID=98228 RepID=UPI000870AA62|nr:DUF6612 family protein [Bacillus sp. OxB-1]
MKNWLKGLAIVMLALALSACNSTATPKTETPSDAEPNTNEETDTKANEEADEQSELTAMEVYEKAMEASEDLKSMHAKMDIQQKIEVPSEDLNMDSKFKMDMDMIMEPLAMYQKMNMDMGEQGAMDTEIYITDAGFFMFDPESEQWLKFPKEMSDDMMEQMGGGTDPTPDMEMFKEFTEDFQFEQTDDEFILTLSAEGEKFNNLMKKAIADSMPAGMEMGEEEAEMMENMNVKSLNFEIFIDKETFQTNAFNMDMDMTMSIEGQEMHIIQQMKSIISQINEVEKIDVPQDVLDNAVDITEAMESQEVAQ